MSATQATAADADSNSHCQNNVPELHAHSDSDSDCDDTETKRFSPCLGTSSFCTNITRARHFEVYLCLLLLVACFVVPVVAPTGKGFRVGGAVSGAHAGSSSGAGSSHNIHLAAAGASLAMAAASAWQLCAQRREGSSASNAAARGSKGPRVGGSRQCPVPMPAAEPHKAVVSVQAVEGVACEYDENDDWFVASAESEDEEGEQEEATATACKLWTNEQFPAGVYGKANYETANIAALLDWRCPCPDRNCISRERLGSEAVIICYEHRKQFRTVTAKKFGRGGLRDAWRAELEGHWDKQSGSCTRSFRVGDLGDCCAPSSALAKGLSLQTHSAAHADCRYERPWHAGRAKAASKQDSYERGHLKAYIRCERARMQGTKGGSHAGEDKWHTGYMPMSKRWQAYVKMRTDAGLPVIGRPTLFAELWKTWSNIEEDKASGHPDCDYCGALMADRVKFEGNTQKLKEIEEDQARAPYPLLLHQHAHARTHAVPERALTLWRRQGTTTSTRANGRMPRTFGSRARRGRIRSPACLWMRLRRRSLMCPCMHGTRTTRSNRSRGPANGSQK